MNIGGRVNVERDKAFGLASVENTGTDHRYLRCVCGFAAWTCNGEFVTHVKGCINYLTAWVRAKDGERGSFIPPAISQVLSAAGKQDSTHE